MFPKRASLVRAVRDFKLGHQGMTATTTFPNAETMLAGDDVCHFYASFDDEGHQPTHSPPVNPPRTTLLNAFQIESLRFFRIWSETHGTEEAYHKWPEVSRGLGYPVMPLHEARKLARELSGLRTEEYWMCVNSCIAFVGVHESSHRMSRDQFIEEDHLRGTTIS